MSYIDGLRGSYTDDEIRHVANDPVRWFATAQGLRETADFLFDAMIGPFTLAAQERTVHAEIQAMKFDGMVEPMYLLYGFALENALKSAIIHTIPDFDYLGRDPSGKHYADQIFIHSLDELYEVVRQKGFVPLEEAERQALRDMSNVVVAQGRYPAAHRKSPDKNTVVYFDPQLRTLICRLIDSVREFIDDSFQQRRESPLGPVVAVIGDGIVDLEAMLCRQGKTVLRRDGLDGG